MREVLSIIIIVLMVASCSSGPIVKASLDNEVRRLCAIDGGIKVYETVKLPPEKFNQWGEINFYHPTHGENAIGDDYLFKTTIFYYTKGKPEMSRTQIQVIRKSDGVLLGESIFYGRGGGDLPGPLHDSSYNCPSSGFAEIPLLSKVFLRNGENEK